MRKGYYYTDVDGDHFPDASLGDELYYSISFACWITNENDEVVDIDWTVPTGITLVENFIQGTEAKAKLRMDAVGSFKVVCTITTKEGTKEQVKQVPMILKVY